MFRYLMDGEPYIEGDQYLDTVMRDWRNIRLTDCGKLHKERYDSVPLVIIRRKISDTVEVKKPTANTTQAEILLLRVTHHLDEIKFGCLHGLKEDLKRYGAKHSAMR